MLRRTAIILCVPALLAGCTSTPDNDDASPPTTTTPDTRRDVPAVDDPLDAGPLATDPCPSLMVAEQTNLGVSQPTRTEVADGVTCDYTGGDFFDLTVFFSNRTSGLSFLYGEHEEGAWGHWRPIEVDGYPAVEYDTVERTETCAVGVGLSDTRYFTVTAAASPGGEFCVRATTVAGIVLDAVKS